MRNPSEAVCKVFPPIGIARVGDSEEWFSGPEVPGALPPEISYKDGQGRVKRQAAVFRVYAFYPDGGVEELGLAHHQIETIEWTVQLANKKAGWHQFAGAKEVARILTGQSTTLRNEAVKDAARNGLEVVPTPVTVQGPESTSGPIEADFRYPDQPAQKVKLGELRTDADGHLLVLGGHGKSASLLEDNPLSHYANNDGWFDDTSDGPVQARIKLKDGSAIDAERGWAVVAPPHFSPHTRNVVTLFDAMAEAAVKLDLDWSEAELGPAPDLTTTSFMRDIYPVLERLSHYPWVTSRAQRGHGSGKRASFVEPAMLRALTDKGDPQKPDQVKIATDGRKRFLARIRKPLVRPLYGDAEPFGVAIDPKSQEARDQATLYFMPAIAGDENDVQHGEPETWFSVTELQYYHLQRWAAGEYTDDLPEDYPDGMPAQFDSLAQVEVAGRPAMLTRTALEMGQGGAFFPGIEITSIIRDRSFYTGDAFRVSAAYQAGDITKWMALPWQADFYECKDHWWPTIRPDDVIPGHEYDTIKEKDGIRGDLRPGLIVGERWARGLDLLPPARPGFPPVRVKETAAGYRKRLTEWLDRVTGTALTRYLPGPMENELGQSYRRRIEEFLDRAFDLPPSVLDPIDASQTNRDYRKAVLAHLSPIFNAQIEPPPATSSTEPASDYRDRLDEPEDSSWSSSAMMQGLLDLEWKRRKLNRGKNDLVANWSQMGFVRAVDPKGQVLVERDRGRFDLLSAREYFHTLMNIENYPEFLPKARELGQEFFAIGRQIHDEVIATDPKQRRYAFFEFDPVTFEGRLEEIYEAEKREGEAYDPVTMAGSEQIFSTPARVVDRIRQLAPFNQLDGSWLERIAKAGPIDDVQSALFEIWSDEIGAGDPAKNHANVYIDLMHSAGIYLPPINSRAYAFHPDLWEGSFVGAAYHSSVALFPETFYPELLGMTLYLEWEAIYLPAMVKLYEYYGYPSLFYRLHVAIDNPVNGHGARARDAVVRYLNDVRARGGEEEMQEHWRRIWDGYIAFKNVGEGEWEYRFANPPSIDDRMIDLIVSKRRYGQLNHSSRRFAGNLLNDWFDEPDQFLAALAESDLVVRGKPGQSSFFAVTGQSGPMLKVFTEKELDLWAEWIASLPPDPVSEQDPASEMVVVLREMSARGRSVAGHDAFSLKGSFRDPAADGALREVEMPVSWWFGIDQLDRLMSALAESSFVVPGNPEHSPLVNEYLRPQRPMARFLSREISELGGVAAREVIVRWISAGCPLPDEARSGALRARTLLIRGLMPGRQAAEVEDFDPEVVRQTLTGPRVPRRMRRAVLSRRGPGAGAVH